ncbi:serine hydrolase domain-containing protein [Aliidiomarina indica]|uniref:serine hydrolase domain-containing protein n=1 Tax=Aliidiomarina indica TaxID=2749147 RepID=UPI00188DCB9F|nr:serine hydrolase domain-containing protein [Aliidiomarina indica]
MKHFLLGVFSVALLASCSAQWTPRALSDEALEHALEAHFQEREAQGFSGLVAIYAGDQRVYMSTHGYANREQEQPITESTVFHLASVSKQWTAAAILALVDAGQLSLQDTLETLFPESVLEKTRSETHQITIHQLLTHSAGLEDFPVPCSQAEAGTLNRDRFLEQALQVPLKHPPGHQFSYSNGGYEILAAVIEITTEMTFEQALRHLFFEPLNLTDTGISPERWDPNSIAIGYDQAGQPWGSLHSLFWGDEGPLWCNRGSGALLSTVADLHRWLGALMNGERLSDWAWQQKQTAHISEGAGASYGYGWSIYQTRQYRELGHTGSLNHILEADVRLYPDTEVMIIVLGNSGEYPATEVLAPILPTIHQWMFNR